MRSIPRVLISVAIVSAWLVFLQAPLQAQDICTITGGTTLGQCKDASGDVVIGSGGKTGCTGPVVIDTSYTVGKITINSGGALILTPGAAASAKPIVTTSGIDIGSGGSLLVAGQPARSGAVKTPTP